MLYELDGGNVMIEIKDMIITAETLKLVYDILSEKISNFTNLEDAGITAIDDGNGNVTLVSSNNTNS